MSSVPSTANGVIAYLTVSDAVAAMTFYGEAFGARELFRETHPGTGKILHAALDLNGGRLFLSDDFPELNGGVPRTPDATGGTSVTLHVQVEDVDLTVVHLVTLGATMVEPVSEKVWGDRFGRIRDPFGHEWAIVTPVAQMKAVEQDDLPRVTQRLI